MANLIDKDAVRAEVQKIIFSELDALSLLSTTKT